MIKRKGSYLLDTDRDQAICTTRERTAARRARLTLHVSRTHHFFLHIEALDADGMVTGESIQPMTEEEARLWAEEHIGGDIDQKITDILTKPEKPPRTKICVSLTEDDKGALDKLKELTGESTTQLMHRWIADELARFA